MILYTHHRHRAIIFTVANNIVISKRIKVFKTIIFSLFLMVNILKFCFTLSNDNMHLKQNIIQKMSIHI